MAEVQKVNTHELNVSGYLKHSGVRVGFYGNEPMDRPDRYTQTYSTASRTHSALTGATVSDATGETPNTAIEAVSIRSSKFWAFDSPLGSNGSFFFGGFYAWHSSAFTPAGGTNVGLANNPYAAHAVAVLGASSTDMVVRVTGTSINDSGTRATSDFEDIDTSGGSSGDYFETSKKFIGQASYSLVLGTGVTINAGFAKYWDNSNEDFTVVGCEATWLAGGSDTGVDIQVLHHKATGWTYGAGGSPTFPTAIASMATDHSTESNVTNGQNGAWKRANLSTAVSGSASEGIMFCVVTTANKAFELGMLEVAITSGGESNRNFSDLADQHNKLLADLANTKQVLNQVIDDLQRVGLLSQ